MTIGRLWQVFPRTLLKWILFLWVIAVASPIRYWPMEATPQTEWLTRLEYAGSQIDTAWIYALNYAAANGLKMGVDIFWTTGLLGYLTAPMDIGSNLRNALFVQAGLWIVIGLVLADTFFWRKTPLRNLALFAVCFALSGPLYWFNMVGVENLLIAAALVLLTGAWIEDSRWRYIAALTLLGIPPLIKFTAGIMAAGVIVGFLTARAWRIRAVPWAEIICTAIPASIFGGACFLLLPSWNAVFEYWHTSQEIISGYSVAMSLAATDGAFEFAGALQILLGLGVLLFVHNRQHRGVSWFLVALLTIPVLLSFKHGFVRQESHVPNFFCFVALAHAVAMLILPVTGRRVGMTGLVLFNCTIVSAQYMASRVGIEPALEMVSGRAGVRLAWVAATTGLHPPGLAASDPHVDGRSITEPAIVAAIGAGSVASLPPIYSGVYFAPGQFRLLPVLQQYSAYTPYLDRLNAAWIRDRGPQFLIAGAWSVDGRLFWTESPATWLETYKWYETYLVGETQILLRRRNEPRFDQLQPVGSGMAVSMKEQLPIPLSAETYWSLSCEASLEGRLRRLAFRVPDVRIVLQGEQEKAASYRSILDVLTSPVPASIPTTLAGLATLLSPESDKHGPELPHTRVSFAGRGLGSYKDSCVLQFWERTSKVGGTPTSAWLAALPGVRPPTGR